MNIKRLSDEQRIRNKREYNRKRDSMRIKKFLLRLDKESEIDSFLIEYINSKPNKNSFIRHLIAREFEKEIKNGTYHADIKLED